MDLTLSYQSLKHHWYELHWNYVLKHCNTGVSIYPAHGVKYAHVPIVLLNLNYCLVLAVSRADPVQQYLKYVTHHSNLSISDIGK